MIAARSSETNRRALRNGMRVRSLVDLQDEHGDAIPAGSPLFVVLVHWAGVNLMTEACGHCHRVQRLRVTDASCLEILP